MKIFRVRKRKVSTTLFIFQIKVSRMPLHIGHFHLCMEIEGSLEMLLTVPLNMFIYIFFNSAFYVVSTMVADFKITMKTTYKKCFAV